jgi:hypothetical protein
MVYFNYINKSQLELLLIFIRIKINIEINIFPKLQNLLFSNLKISDISY